MLGAIAIIPSAPVLVPELAGAAAAELADLRAAVFAAATALPACWVAVGAGPAADHDTVFPPDLVGTFAGFGVDVAVRLSRRAHRPAQLPLCALLAGWVRDQVRPDAQVWVHTCAADAEPAAAAARGAALRAEIERSPEPTGVLVLADGANTLTPAAPGGYRPADLEVQQALDDALGRGDAGALTALPPQVVGRAGLAMLAGLVGRGPQAAKELYRGAPFGVGYFAGVWQP